MNDVTLISISRGTPKTLIELVVDVDQKRHRCVFEQIPGRTAMRFDNEFDRVFSLTDFARPLGQIVSRFVHGQVPTLPMRVEPYIPARHAG